MIDIHKTISIQYNTMEDLLEREEAMNQTLANYLARDNRYEFYDSRIVVEENKVRLILEIKLKDEYNERTDY